MRRLLKSLRRHYLKLTNAKTVRIDGVLLACGSEDVPAGVREDLFRNTYEDTERKLLLQVLQPGMKVVEIGAGIGFIGLLASRIVGDSNVWSYEANPSLEPIIRGNYDLNGLTPTLTMKAVTRDGSPITFFRSDNIVSSSVFDRARGDKQITVESVAFDDIMSELHPDVVIMDVEGAEIELLASQMRQEIRHLIVEMHAHIVGQQKIDGLVSHLEQEGFKLEARNRKTLHLKRVA
jgi:FkbM family methyltransferase